MLCLCNLILAICVAGVFANLPLVEFRNVTKSWSAPKPVIWIYDKHLVKNDHSFLYANCKAASDLSFTNSKEDTTGCECSVTVEMPTLIPDAVTRVRTCNMKHRVPSFGVMSNPAYIVLEVLGDDRVLIRWKERYPDKKNNPFISFEETGPATMRMAILNMIDCSIKALEFSNEVRWSQGPVQEVITSSDTFDVFFSNKTLCGSSQCRIKYDKDGNEVGEPVPFYTSLRIPSVMDPSPDKPSFFLVGFPADHLGKLALRYVNANGTEKNLTDTFKNIDTTRYSNDHELLGFCWTFKNKTTQCKQFDSDANVLIDITFELDSNGYILSIHNQKNGGILILTANIEEKMNDRFETLFEIVGDTFKVSKIGNNTGVEELYNMRKFEFQCNNKNEYSLDVDYVESNEEFCFYFVCPYSDENTADSTLTLSKRCATK
ncbi:hypothetical protein QAD02_006164 [Eretmocerus hayati]|uniref:Uncharacterized protein n=1 Tax=Eretmocerus hayati TaxID=131215 RepID=A0ACC2N0B5_9HYME|nr:hypothetical protein QAD02_006164 [Eretmocerus hayati]